MEPIVSPKAWTTSGVAVLACLLYLYVASYFYVFFVFGGVSINVCAFSLVLYVAIAVFPSRVSCPAGLVKNLYRGARYTGSLLSYCSQQQQPETSLLVSYVFVWADESGSPISVRFNVSFWFRSDSHCLVGPGWLLSLLTPNTCVCIFYLD